MGIVKGSLDKGKIRLQRKLKIPNYLTFETTADQFGYFWTNSVGTLQYGTVEPTTSTYDTAGTSLTTTTGADAALSNLSSVAINTTIASDTDSTDDLGTSSIFWANAFIDKIYLYSDTHAIDGSGGSTIVVTGGTAFGVSGTGIDVQFYGTTAGKDMLWDESRDALALTDSAKIEFGASQDLVIYHDGTDNHIDSGTGNMVINFGANTATDVIFHGANDNIHFDASADLLRLEDTFILGFGTGGSTDYDIGLAYAAAGTLSWTQKVAETGSILKGVNGRGIDETWYSETAGDYMKWDEDGGTGNVGALTFEDSLIKISGANVHYELGISTDSLLLDATDNANAKLILGSTGTNGLDVDFIGASSGDHVKFVSTGTWTFTDVNVTMTGANSSNILLQVTGIDTTGNTDTVVIDHSGSGNALYIDQNEADSQGITVEPFANSTVAAIEIDGDAAGWAGADNVGMLHLRNDIPQVHTGATMLLVDNSGQPIASAEGFLARFLDTGTARTTAYAVEIETTNTTPALKLNNQMTITGANSGGVLFDITAIDTTGNSDTMTIDHSGTGSGLKITATEADSVALTAIAATSQTTALVHLDGSTGTWLGADGVGMLDLDNDGTFAHINSSLLLITNSGVPQNDSRGHCLRIVDTGNAAAGTAGYAVYLSASDATVEALYVDAGEVLVDEYLKAGPTATTGGLVTAYDTADYAATPTDANFDTAFGATALGKAGFLSVAEDSTDGKTYLVVSDGTTWHYVALTAAT